MLEDLELFLSDKIVTIINSFVTEQSFCIARMVFRRLRNLLKPKLNCEKLTKDMKDTGEPPDSSWRWLTLEECCVGRS